MFHRLREATRTDLASVLPKQSHAGAGARGNRHREHLCSSLAEVASPSEMLIREHTYLRGLDGRDFFLALEPYTAAVSRDETTRRVLDELEAEVSSALSLYKDEYGNFVEEARLIRQELAARAPEIDNSDMERPDERSHEWIHYDLDSFARFDELANAELVLGFPTLPDDQLDPGHDGQLLGILRGRLRAAEYGEDASELAEARIRDDLRDLARRIGNLGEQRAHALRRYRQQSRNLPGVAFARLVHFGATLNPEPDLIEEEADLAQRLERMIREVWTPSRTVRKLVNAEQMDDAEQQYVGDIEATLKAQLDRVHQELLRRAPAARRLVELFLRNPVIGLLLGGVVTIIATVASALILVYVFGIGD